MANFLAQLPARADDARNPVRELLSFTLPAHHARFAGRFGVRLRTCFTSTEICVVAELPRTEATLRVRKAELRARGRSAAAWDAAAG